MRESARFYIGIKLVTSELWDADNTDTSALLA